MARSKKVTTVRPFTAVVTGTIIGVAFMIASDFMMESQIRKLPLINLRYSAGVYYYACTYGYTKASGSEQKAAKQCSKGTDLFVKRILRSYGGKSTQRKLQ